MKIQTENDITLSVQIVNPYIDEGKVKIMRPRELCLVIEGSLFLEDGTEVEFCEPVLLNKDGAKQLLDEIEGFVITPF